MISRRFYTAAVIALGLGMILAGCGTSTTYTESVPNVSLGTPESTAPESEASDQESEVSASSSAPPPSVHYVGSVTQTGSGAELVENVSLSTIGYGESAAPPQEVPESSSDQDLASETVTDMSAYVYGVLKLSYIGGRVPIEPAFREERPFGNLSGSFREDTEARVFYEIDGRWTESDNEEDPPVFSMSPNQTLDVPIWLQFGNAVSNTQDSIPQKELNPLSWEIIPSIEQELGGNPTTTASGPQAADCGGEQLLLPFANPPSSPAGEQWTLKTGEPASCKPVK